jgi:hypothetical protein
LTPTDLHVLLLFTIFQILLYDTVGPSWQQLTKLRITLSFSDGEAARHLLQLPNLPSLPNLPKPTLPPLPSIPTLPQPTLPTLPATQPSLPKPPLPPLPILPTMPAIPKVTLLGFRIKND